MRLRPHHMTAPLVKRRVHTWMTWLETAGGWAGWREWVLGGLPLGTIACPWPLLFLSVLPSCREVGSFSLPHTSTMMTTSPLAQEQCGQQTEG